MTAAYPILSNLSCKGYLLIPVSENARSVESNTHLCQSCQVSFISLALCLTTVRYDSSCSKPNEETMAKRQCTYSTVVEWSLFAMSLFVQAKCLHRHCGCFRSRPRRSARLRHHLHRSFPSRVHLRRRFRRCSGHRCLPELHHWLSSQEFQGTQITLTDKRDTQHGKNVHNLGILSTTMDCRSGNSASRIFYGEI